jgi:mannose/fructose/N-acetylgalactosamine-specific phosphotransferase system component IIC
VEGLHVVGDILTKISVNCVINYMMHYYLHLYFYGFILCVVYNCLYIYGIACICCMYMFIVISI